MQIIVGMLVSAVTGLQNPRKLNPGLIHSFPGLKFNVGKDYVSKEVNGCIVPTILKAVKFLNRYQR